MSTAPTEAAAARVARLRAALDTLADALAHGDLDGLLQAEPRLSEALDILGRDRQGYADPALVREIEGARHALLRCRRLGASLSDLARLAAGADADGCYRRGGAHAIAGQAATMGTRG